MSDGLYHVHNKCVTHGWVEPSFTFAEAQRLSIDIGRQEQGSYKKE